jgi:hypothetical protein
LGEETELQIIVVWSIKTTLWKILEWHCKLMYFIDTKVWHRETKSDWSLPLIKIPLLGPMFFKLWHFLWMQGRSRISSQRS